jgi:hypothetical protein
MIADVPADATIIIRFLSSRYFRGVRWGTHRQHPAVHGAGERKRAIRDYVHVGNQQRAYQRH